MSWNARRASVVLLALFVAGSAYWLEEGQAQVKVVLPPMPGGMGGPAPGITGAPGGGNPAVDPDGFLNNGIHLAKDEKGRGKLIEAVVDYIDQGTAGYRRAIENLQKLVQMKEDVFVRLKRKNAEGREIFVWVSAKQEADRLIGSLPPEALDLYKGTYGAEAAALLKKAKQTGDPVLLNDIMKLYAHTDAGLEAIKLLADYKFDRGEYMPALLCYCKIINRLGEEKTPIPLLAKAAWAAHLAPPSSSSKNTITAGSVYSEKELWKMLKSRTREIQFGEQTLSPEELEEHVAKLDRSRLEENAANSPIYRATLNRSNQLVGGPAFMARDWAQPLVYSGYNAVGVVEARSALRAAKTELKNHHQPLIPGAAAITLTAIGSKGEKIPLVVYKDYSGIMARDLRNGTITWRCDSPQSLQALLSEGNKSSGVNSWLGYYKEQHPQMIFENSTVSTLSSDGQYVYMVEDYAVPPQSNYALNGMNQRFPNPSGDTETEKKAGHNQLHAFTLDKNSGKFSWALPSDESEKDPLFDHYFLGPPLPLAGKLFVLAEKQQEIRLISLDPTTTVRIDNRDIPKPAILSMQTLGLTEEKMQDAPLRRAAAAHLAYGEGVLVCPTNAGAVFGVNLLENSLAWAYPYRGKNDAPAEQPMNMNNMRFRGGQWPPPGFRLMPDGRVVAINSNPNNPWKVTAPVISDGKVVFTAPDTLSLHCINLRDGSLNWNSPKHDDDLYLGNVYNGVVLVVGKKNVRGLSLSQKGDTLWTLEVGMPSGQGIGSGSIYYLPIQGKDENGSDAQIVGIDMERGKIVSRSKARPRQDGKAIVYDVPGNLLFHEGKVVSLTADEIAVYPQLKAKLAELDEDLVKNPNDPKILTERGDLRLDKGDLPGAIDDLMTALKTDPPKELRERARAKLYETLTAYITDHFNDAEKYLDEYQELCKVNVESASGTERIKLEAEQRRRRATYLWLVGKGREEQGRLVEAFENYQQFAAEAGKQSELVPAIDDSQVKAAPDVWSRGRILAMMNKAKPEHRKPLEKLIADKWDKLRQTNDLQELRAFVRMFGAVSDAGKEARLELAERLMDQKDSGEEHPLVEAELELNQFRTGRHSPELAARATEALARLYLRKGLLEDAAYCYRKLGKEYAKIRIRDGKTGEQIYEEDAATDKRLIPYLDEPMPLGSVKRFYSKAIHEASAAPGGGHLFQFEHSGENLPYFRHHIVGLNLSKRELLLLDRRLEEANGAPKIAWRKQEPSTEGFSALVNAILNNNVNQINPNMGGMFVGNASAHPQTRFCYETVGHLIVLPLGSHVFGLDPVNRRKLWERDLLAEVSGPMKTDANGNVQMLGSPSFDPRDGSALIVFAGGWAQRLGQVSPFEGQTICVQSRDKLSALDPLTGRTLWSRLDVHSRNFLFADEEYVFVVELDNNSNKPISTRVFRAADGVGVRAPDFAALFEKRLQQFGRYLLVSDTSATNGVTLRLYDMVTGEDAWKQNYPARSLVAKSEDATRTAIVEPNGKVHVVDLRQRKEVMAGELNDPSEELKNVQGFHLLADRYNYYLASQTAAPNGGLRNVPPTSVESNLGMRTVLVEGYLHAFKHNGEYNWNLPPDKDGPLYLLLDRLQESPLLFLTARVGNDPNGGGAGVMMPGMVPPGGMPQGAWAVKATVLQKWNGIAAFNQKFPTNLNTGNFFSLRIDPRAGTVEMLSSNLKIRLFPKPDERNLDKDKPEAVLPRSRDVVSPPRSQTAETRIPRPALERARIREIAPPLSR